ncbi:MAG: hypothetical protein QNJ97_06540 [Myxococcota bacterium]|nr:hypothetical protein [Myxococcota bacterium]
MIYKWVHNGILEILAVSAITALAMGCGSDECENSSDCSVGEVCVSGSCQPSEGDSTTNVDTSSETASDTDTDTDGDTDGDTDTDTDTDADTDTTSDTDTDTGTEETCEATLLNGQACQDSCECISDHCEGGVCCSSGECCQSADDCDDSSCTGFYCSGNFQCMYSNAVFECGEQDLGDGDVCTGDNVCDGFGNCVTLVVDCGWYNPNGEFSCTDGSAQADCYTSCTQENQAINCDQSQGAGCQDGICLPDVGLENGEACGESFQCKSGYCGDGFCCPAGECCAQVSDCDDSGCVTRLCNGSSQCVYNELACGTADTEDGDTCDGASLCDGLGNCATVATCDGAYAFDGTYTCDQASVQEDCFSSCVNVSHCNAGYTCEGGECITSGLANGSACTLDSQCESGHCGDGFCCPAGECCAQASDCNDTLCNTRVCNPNFQCVYNVPAELSCGKEDTSTGFQCTGDNRCDGYGNCVPLDRCTDAYSWDADGQGTGFSCASEYTALEVCHASCVNALQCNNGYVCDTNACVPDEGTPNGDTCTQDSDCASGNCENNMCCPAGEECCQDASDCDNSLCVLRYCDGNNACQYHDVSPCATPDQSDGDTCMGASLCDGVGSCAVVDTCDGAYAATGDYSCGPGSVAEDCYTSCTTRAQCNDGYACSSGACIDKIPNGQGTCTQNEDCESGYCTTSTGICCDGGWCCNDNDQCGAYSCDPGTWSCEFSCDNSGDDDSLCTAMGDFHCDNGSCYEDLQNGEFPCDEPSDCLSNYCDVSSGICCNSGTCCADDSDCDGFLCTAGNTCETDCSPLGAEDDALCAEGYHCTGSTCVADIPNGQGTCVENSDCASDNCNPTTGICCSLGTGDCCSNATQCDDANACTIDYCSATFHCYQVDATDGQSCGDGAFCNGVETCQSGVCTPGTAQCTGSTGCMNESCDEDADECIQTPINAGDPCTDVLFCIGDVQKVCTETGLCLDPGTGTPPCTGSTGNPCTEYQCNEATNNCDEIPMVDGYDCDDSDPCNGENVCESGVCVDGVLPCDDFNPCTTDNCTDNGGTAECGTHDPVANGGLCENAPCFGDGATCWSGDCIPSADTDSRPCYDGDISTYDECTDFTGSIECDAITRNPTTITCGTTTPLVAKDFSSFEYYTYDPTLCPGTYPGSEAAVTLNVASDSAVTIGVSNVDPAMNIEVMLLGDWTDPTTCTNHNTDSLTLPLTGSTIDYVFVLEAGELYPPTDVDVEVTCTPL